MNYQRMNAMEAMECLREKPGRVVGSFGSLAEYRICDHKFQTSTSGLWRDCSASSALFGGPGPRVFRLVKGPGSEEEGEEKLCPDDIVECSIPGQWITPHIFRVVKGDCNKLLGKLGKDKIDLDWVRREGTIKILDRVERGYATPPKPEFPEEVRRAIDSFYLSDRMSRGDWMEKVLRAAKKSRYFLEE